MKKMKPNEIRFWCLIVGWMSSTVGLILIMMGLLVSSQHNLISYNSVFAVEFGIILQFLGLTILALLDVLAPKKDMAVNQGN